MPAALHLSPESITSPAQPDTVLGVTDLCKSYAQVTAVEHVSFNVQRNEIVGLLGPNGAGKTTTINMILGVLAPTRGAITIGGIDVAKRRSQALARTNFAAVYATLPGNLSGAALALAQLVLAGYLFARVFRYTVKTGLLARYSAESVG